MRKLILKHQIALAERAGLGPEHAAKFEVLAPYDPDIIVREALKRMDRLRAVELDEVRKRPKLTTVLVYAATFLDGKPGYEEELGEIKAFLNECWPRESCIGYARSEPVSPLSPHRGKNKRMHAGSPRFFK